MAEDAKSRLYAADQADTVLSIYEDANPGDTHVRDAIEAARAFARGEIDAATLAAAHDTVRGSALRTDNWRDVAGGWDYHTMSQAAAAHIAWNATQPLMLTPSSIDIWVGLAYEWAGKVTREAA